ncbi:MAG: hypothetical protein LBH06_03065, partial [Rikenellaceae bacterium]|nr:hypothetical protein [Rikenellaceae bacterium]
PRGIRIDLTHAPGKPLYLLIENLVLKFVYNPNFQVSHLAEFLFSFHNFVLGCRDNLWLAVP